MLVLDPVARTLTHIAAPRAMDNSLKRVLNDYVIAPNADRDGEIATALVVFDGVREAFAVIDVPEQAGGFVINPTSSVCPEVAMAVTLAANENSGDRGLLVFDLGSGRALHYALPEGFRRVLAPASLARAGRPPYGLLLAPPSAAVPALSSGTFSPARRKWRPIQRVQTSL